MQNISEFLTNHAPLAGSELNQIRGGKKNKSYSKITGELIDEEKIDRKGNIKWSKTYDCECE